MYDPEKKHQYYQEHKEKQRLYSIEYRKKHKQELSEKKKIYQKQYRIENKDCISRKSKEYYEKNKEEYLKKIKKQRTTVRYKALSKITIFRGRGVIKCHRCGEDRFNLLTLAHLNNDGKYERLEKHTITTMRDILKGDRRLEDLEIECFQCNWCLDAFGCYPDQLPLELKGVKVEG